MIHFPAYFEYDKCDFCEFPFTYKGVTYYDCACADYEEPWCSRVNW